MVLAVCNTAFSRQANAQAEFLCKNCGSADNSVLVLDAQVPSVSLATIGWKTNAEHEFHSDTFLLRPGRHAYDFHSNPAWKGDIAMLLHPEEPSMRFVALRAPTMADSLDIFLEPEFISWGQPNVLRRGPKLVGLDYDLLLLALCPVVVCFALLLFRQPLRTSLLIGLVLSFLLMDFRSGYEHVRTMNALETNFFFAPWKENEEILDKLAASIPSVPWCEKEMAWPWRTLANYKLLRKPVGRGKQCRQRVVVTPENFMVERVP